MKPPRWNVQEGLTDPSWRWAWRDLVFAHLFLEGLRNPVLVGDYEKPEHEHARDEGHLCREYGAVLHGQAKYLAREERHQNPP